ncbi:NUDIX hydrolase [Crossiella sp. SN42]|uniref:NUDIX hydrolase n=1 Tax=Crossiella sp. SN42 TaxID=2944808 RepID=UPI00207CA240|nr:NUDIX domain-containing protein [Crossiella sp. SN42]MCO1575157.1 NUDIX hydrolase [Crossiella sp. SN42]
MTDRVLPRVTVAVDLVVFTVREGDLHVLLVRRGKPPFSGELALPGGFVEEGEDLDEAVERELKEETGLDSGALHLEQFGAYGTAGRDPRGQVISLAYVALMPDLPLPTAGGDAHEAHWIPVSTASAPGALVAFDHRDILATAVERVRTNLEYTTVGAAFCPAEFTVADLRRVYELVWGQALDPRNFHRKVTGIPDFLVPTGAKTTRDGGRPAELYRRGVARLLHPPLLRAHPG